MLQRCRRLLTRAAGPPKPGSSGLRTLVPLLLLLLGVPGGCNPGLISAVGGNTAADLPPPAGPIVIIVFNFTTSETSRTNVLLTMNNGSQLTLSIVTPTGQHAARVQDCYVASIQVQEVITQDNLNNVFTTPASVSPIVSGQGLNCGNVVSITLTGAPGNVFVDVRVF